MDQLPLALEVVGGLVLAQPWMRQRTMLDSGVSGPSDFDNMLPAFGTDIDYAADNEKSGPSSRPKKKNLPNTRVLSTPRGGASLRER